MRKGISVLVAAVLVAGVLALAACGPAKPKEKVLGMSFPAADHGWVAAVIYNAKKQADELGVKYILTTGANPSEQSAKVDELIAQKVSAVIMLPSDTKPLTPAAQRILNAKIPLIIFDRKVELEPTFYLAGDNAGIGVNAAKFIGEKLGGKGTVVSIGVPAYGSVHTERVNAFKDTLTQMFPKIKLAKEVGAENSSKEAGLKIMSDLLNAEKRIDAVFTIDDELSIGVLQAISENKRKDIKIETGAGGAQEYFNQIKAGGPITLASFLYSPLMVKDAVKYAVDIMNGKMPEQKSIIIPASPVTKENVDQYLDPNSPY
ncbi:MAG: substrate-binding domain-containing protein [Spirochaetia bacterium]|jgi:ribose transport system substrate-binding protein